MVSHALNGSNGAATMKFGKQLQTETLPEWREFYMNYRRLKRAIKRLQMEKDASEAEAQKEATETKPLLDGQKAAAGGFESKNSFDEELEKEIDKVDTFFTSKLTQCTEELTRLMDELRLGGEESASAPSRRKSEALFRYYKTGNESTPDEAILRVCLNVLSMGGVLYVPNTQL